MRKDQPRQSNRRVRAASERLVYPIGSTDYPHDSLISAQPSVIEPRQSFRIDLLTAFIAQDDKVIIFYIREHSEALNASCGRLIGTARLDKVP